MQIKEAAVQPQAAQQPFSIFNELELRLFERRIKGEPFGQTGGERCAGPDIQLLQQLACQRARNAAFPQGAAHAKLPQRAVLAFALVSRRVRAGAVADAEDAAVDRKGG